MIQQAVINTDPECAELIVYDQANYVGDQICFKGTGDAAMGDYWISSPFVSWAGNVYSWDSISSTGFWKDIFSTTCSPVISSGVSDSPTSGNCWSPHSVGFLHKSS